MHQTFFCSSTAAAVRDLDSEPLILIFTTVLAPSGCSHSLNICDYVIMDKRPVFLPSTSPFISEPERAAASAAEELELSITQTCLTGLNTATFANGRPSSSLRGFGCVSLVKLPRLCRPAWMRTCTLSWSSQLGSAPPQAACCVSLPARCEFFVLDQLHADLPLQQVW